jgi:hypothetical protein
LAAASVPMRPPAPGRLSTTTCWPHAAVSFSPISRAITSEPSPGGLGTITRIGFEGNAWAAANGAATRSTMKAINLMFIP